MSWTIRPQPDPISSLREVDVQTTTGRALLVICADTPAAAERLSRLVSHLPELEALAEMVRDWPASEWALRQCATEVLAATQAVRS